MDHISHMTLLGKYVCVLEQQKLNEKKMEAACVSEHVDNRSK